MTSTTSEPPATPSKGADAGAVERALTVGRRLREHRMRKAIGVRELARRVNVSASLISQVELGKATPSVGTLYAIVSELGLSLDSLFADRDNDTRPTDLEASASRVRSGPSPVVRRAHRQAIQLESGVEWELLTPETEDELEFLHVTYAVGGASCTTDQLMRHGGYEYGYVIEGELGVTVAFDTYSLHAGDAISFDSNQPHRLFAVGDQPARALWFLVGRRGQARSV